MKLYYYRFSKGIKNFGDDLNPWLWKQLIPGELNGDRQSIFVGIGTLLNDHLPKASQTVVFSSGVGYGKGLPNMNESWKIYCLRGPLSAKRLGVAEELAVTDGAVLIRRLFNPTGKKLHKFAFMPHIKHAIKGGKVWKAICEELGYKYIDPRSPLQDVLSAINHTEVLLAEAMHGAIVADTLRVPWIPVCTDSTILSFKWQDWCLSMKVKYQPQYVLPLPDLYPAGPGIRSSVRYWGNWVNQDKFKSLNHLWGDKRSLISYQLDRIAKTTKPTLSKDKNLESITQQLEEKLEQFKADVAAGYFHP